MALDANSADAIKLLVGAAVGVVAMELIRRGQARAITRGELGNERHLHATPGDPKADPPAIRRDLDL
jgi:hypothetical protein